MAHRQFIILLIVVITAAGLTVWGGWALSTSLGMPPIAWVLAGPAFLVAFIVWRLTAWWIDRSERRGPKE